MPMKKEKEREITFNKRDLSRTVMRNMRERERVLSREISERVVSRQLTFMLDPLVAMKNLQSKAMI